METPAASAPGPGRPRDPRIDRAVLDATNELLERVGYGPLTISAIAELAGTTKTAIYRRWPTKAHLVHEAAFPDPGRGAVGSGAVGSGAVGSGAVGSDCAEVGGDGGAPGAPSHADLAAHLRTMLATGVEVLGRPATRAAIPGLLVALGSNAELQGELRQRFVGGSFQQLFDLVDAAIVAGDVRPDTDASVLLDLVSGAAFLATATHGPDEIGDDWVDGVVALIVRGIAP